MFFGSNWTWLAERWGNMADLAERVDDLICSFDSSGDTTMDTLSMLIFGWMLFGLIVLCVGKYVYNRFALNGIAGTKVPSSSGSGKEHGHSFPGHTSVDGVVIPGAVTGAGGTVLAGVGFPGINKGGNAQSVRTPGSSVPLSSQKSSSLSSSGVSGGQIGNAGSNNTANSGYVPPTPPVRKRLTRKTSGPLISPARSSRALHLPTATGADAEAVRWVNELIIWLHSDLVILNELLATWVISLNEFTRNSVEEHGVGVEFVRVLPETHSPVLSNIFCECDSKDDVTITCDCEATPALQLKSFRQRGEKVEVSHYRVNVNRFRARLHLVCITEKLILDLKCDGWPEIKVSLAPVGTIKKDLDESQLQEVVNEIVVGALRGTNVHLNLSQYPTCPRLWREPPPQQGFSLPLHYDSMMHQNLHSSTNMQYARGERRLLVKIVKASDIGGNDGCKEPYCVVELDEPPQKNQTSIKRDDSKNPNWDEAFLFDVSRNTSEVLLEVYDHIDKTSQRFLGLGIVGVEELLINPSQRQIIPLQARPYEQDEVTGTLTVEFLFIEGAEVPQIGNKPYKLKETIKQPQQSLSPPGSPGSPTTQTATATATTRSYTPTKNLLNNTNLNYNNDYLSNGNGLDSSSSSSPYRTGQFNGNKGTLIVHSQQRQPERQIVKVALTEAGNWQEVSPEHGTKDNSAASGPESTPNSSNSEGLRERGRTRRKRRDFFGTIKRRLGRSKNRSRSVGPESGDVTYNDANSRSISADRGARDPGSGLLSVPGREEQSRRSSLSEASAVSGTSTRTYLNEASTLVLETLENGIKKHFLVPLSLAQKSKWRKKGTKLHIFNDHTFIAKHMQGGTICEVCKRTLARRLGKQGYECRDCQLKCHKHCHVKVESNCQSSTIQSIELSLLPVLSE